MRSSCVIVYTAISYRAVLNICDHSLLHLERHHVKVRSAPPSFEERRRSCSCRIGSLHNSCFLSFFNQRPMKSSRNNKRQLYILNAYDWHRWRQWCHSVGWKQFHTWTDRGTKGSRQLRWRQASGVSCTAVVLVSVPNREEFRTGAIGTREAG